MHSMIGKSRLVGAMMMGLLSAGVAAQGSTLGANDYARAEHFLIYNTMPLVDHAVQKVDWLDDSHFWYRDHDTNGDHFVQMDVASGKTTPLFDQVKLAAALGKVTGKPVDAKKLPVTGYSVKPDGSLDIAVRDKEPGVLSPDKQSEAFIRNWNLWVRDLATGKETQLTTDGAKDFGYATDNAGWIHTDRAVLNWSPDSKKIATYQQDQRGVGEMYTVRTKVGHPELDAWKYPLPGDDKVFMIEPVVIDVDSH